MSRTAWWMGFAMLVLVGGLWAQKPTPMPPTPPKPDAPKGTEIDLAGLKSVAPTAWKSEKPSNRLRSHQFRLPHADEDKHDAELAILPDVRGTVEQNIARWKEWFVPPPNMPADEAAKTITFQAGKGKVTCLDIQGTYLQRDKPIDTAAKEVRPDYRMIAAILEAPEGSFTIRLTGPKKTVAMHAKAFDQWLRNFK